jgi:hypothetical protein
VLEFSDMFQPSVMFSGEDLSMSMLPRKIPASIGRYGVFQRRIRLVLVFADAIPAGLGVN